MTKVRSAAGIRASGTARASAVRPKAAGAGFAVASHDLARTVAAAAPAANGALLLLQDEAAPFHRDREAARGGKHALAALNAMQIGLLSGDPRRALAALEAALQNLPEAADPGLRAIIAAIRQRGHIEAARFAAAELSRAPSPRPAHPAGDDPSVTR